MMSKITCKQCGKETSVPASAENKKFCSDKCRNSWHSARRAKAIEMLNDNEKETSR